MFCMIVGEKPGFRNQVTTDKVPFNNMRCEFLGKHVCVSVHMFCCKSTQTGV